MLQYAAALRVLLLDEAGELVVEARNAAAPVQQVGVAAGPGRVRRRVDVERQLVAFLTVGRTGLVGAAIGHHDGDEVVVGVRVGLHGGVRSLAR